MYGLSMNYDFYIVDLFTGLEQVLHNRCLTAEKSVIVISGIRVALAFSPVKDRNDVGNKIGV